MSDFNIKMTVRNARLLRLVREQYGTAAEMARRTGLSVQNISALMTLRMKPIKTDGEWREIALNIAGALGVDPAEIWPHYLRDRALKKATAEVELSAEQVAQLVAPADDPADVIERQDTVARLMSCLSERQARIVHERMHGATLEDLARELGVGCERIRQIEWKAHRVMRTQAKRLGLDAA